PEQKTHREVKKPQISGRHLADYMAASERGGRSIVRNCKYQPIARVVQHDEAKAIIAKFIRDGDENVAAIRERANEIRGRLADSDFDRDLFDHNADYIDRFADIAAKLALPDAELLAPGKSAALNLKGVKVTADIHFRLRRLTKTNKIRIGAGMLRYAKGKTLPRTIAEWQSAFLFGYMNLNPGEEAADAEHKLCITVDAYEGTCYPAPTDSARRFQNMVAACETIAEWWPNIPPPPNAVL
ncbi:MAG: hypothetical protein WCA81_14875, partial [Rhizomicrobium sp.]